MPDATDLHQHALFKPLLYAARVPCVDPEHLSQELALLTDWSGLLALASYHRLTPLLYRAVQPVGEVLPEAVLHVLRESAQQHLGRSLYLSAELSKLLRMLETHRIEAVPFKGPVLESLLYGTPGLRCMDDLDLFVEPAAVQRLDGCLRELGFRTELELSGRRAELYRATQVEQAYLRSEPYLNVDVHWGLVPSCFSFAPKPREWLDRLMRVPGGSFSAPTFSLEDTLLLLCQHGCKHGWGCLSWSRDVAALLTAHPELSASLVAERARRLGMEGMVALGTRLAGELFECKIPLTLQALSTDLPALENLTQSIYADLLRDRRPAMQTFSASLIYPRSMALWRDRWRCYLRPSIKDWEAFRLPVSLYPLYYVLRPSRLLFKRREEGTPPTAN